MPRPKGSKGVGGQKRHCLICNVVIPTGQDGLVMILGASPQNGERVGWLCLDHAHTMIDAVQKASKKRLDVATPLSE